jgi:uncharacterized membrane protein
MQKKASGFASSNHFKVFIVFHVATWFAVGFNIPILRQFLGFLYLSFIPGLVILKALHVNQRSVTHIFLFSVGLSLAFVMFIGLLLDWILPLIGLSAALNTFNLIITVTILEFILLLTRQLYPSKDSLFVKPKFVASKSLLLIVSVPLCSILGAILVDYYANNLLLLFTFVMICALFLLSAFGKISPRLYPLVIVAIALALLFQNTVANHYLNGFDIHLEYYLAQITKNNQYWNPSLMSTIEGSNFNTMLSITILPTIYSNVLNLNIFYVYTIIYPLLFSLVPLALYQVYEGHFGSRFAFWSAFLFVSSYVFYVDMTYLARQMIAELFFVLIFLLLLERGTKRNSTNTQVMLIVFAFATVVSHYSTAFICIFYLLFFSSVSIRNSTTRSRIVYLSLFACITFSWYIFVSNSTPVVSLVHFGQVVTSSFQDFFVAQSKNPVLSFALGTPSLVNEISRIVFLLINALIAIGILGSFVVRKGVTFSKEFFAISVMGALLIFASIGLPNFAAGLTIGRTFQLALFFTAPFLVVGSQFIFRIATKLTCSIRKMRLTRLHWTSIRLGPILLVTLLIIYLLFQSGVVNELAGGVPTSLSLTIDKGRLIQAGNIGAFDAFTFAGDVYGARWLSNHTILGSTLCSDQVSSKQVLVSYGMINPLNITVLSNNSTIPENSYIYLRTLNVVYGIFEDANGGIRNITEFSKILTLTDTVYSNGESEVLLSTQTSLP